MGKSPDSKSNYEKTREAVGYVNRLSATPETYKAIGFKSGLEIHQQLLTDKKLFCRCPAGIYQARENDFDAELVRHMRPTLSELGEYDGTALMEFKTRKDIYYRIADETACTYDIDDTPPFPVNRDALDIALEIGLLLKTNIVGELHITRKQYLDGSIPTGFQRTAIVGIEGEIPAAGKTIRIIQISIEEDSCREVIDVGHKRVYTTDRLGMPLIETVTAPDMITPDEVAEVCDYLRFLVRSTGKVRTGIGAARQDVNVSVTGGTRIEIKGVAHIRWIPELTHNEAFRQVALLRIKGILNGRIDDVKSWEPSYLDLDSQSINIQSDFLATLRRRKYRLVAVNLPGFDSILSHFTGPGRMFADEISDRLKVVACIEKPNMTHSETIDGIGASPVLPQLDWTDLEQKLGARAGDAQILLWGPDDDILTAVETIEERCRLAFEGVPNETRKSFPDGTTVFERVLPGPDRMYPDTDSAPISIHDDELEKLREGLPSPVSERLRQLQEWNVPEDCFEYLLRRNLVWIIERIVTDFGFDPKFIGTFFGHRVNCFDTRVKETPFSFFTLYHMFGFIHRRGLDPAIAIPMLAELYANPKMVFDSILTAIQFKPHGIEELSDYATLYHRKFSEIGRSTDSTARTDWVMGRMRPAAVGNIPMRQLYEMVTRGGGHE